MVMSNRKGEGNFHKTNNKRTPDWSMTKKRKWGESIEELNQRDGFDKNPITIKRDPEVLRYQPRFERLKRAEPLAYLWGLEIFR